MSLVGCPVQWWVLLMVACPSSFWIISKISSCLFLKSDLTTFSSCGCRDTVVEICSISICIILSIIPYAPSSLIAIFSRLVWLAPQKRNSRFCHKKTWERLTSIQLHCSIWQKHKISVLQRFGYAIKTGDWNMKPHQEQRQKRKTRSWKYVKILLPKVWIRTRVVPFHPLQFQDIDNLLWQPW